MSRPANPYDNATCEIFLKTLKREEIHATDYRDFEELNGRVKEFIEQYYNRSRLHSALSYQSPDSFEGAAQEASQRSSTAAIMTFFSNNYWYSALSMLWLGRCDAPICLNVGFALAACEKPLCAQGVHEPDIPSAGARATSARITAMPCLVSSGSRPEIGYNGLGNSCLRLGEGIQPTLRFLPEGPECHVGELSNCERAYAFYLYCAAIAT